MPRSPIRSIVAALALVAFWAGGAPAARADAVIHVSKGVGPPTTQVDVTGSGFGVSETVDVDFDTTLLGTGTTDVSGELPAVRITVPASALPGPHTITATGETSGLSASVAFNVRTDWTQFMFGPRRGGRNPFENVINPDNAGSLVQMWAGKTGLSIFGGAVVYRGLVYIASADERLYAFDSRTGATVWTVQPGGELQGFETPAIYNGILYLSASPKLHALDASNGHEIWSAPVGRQTSPAVIGGVVYATAERSLWALDALTGTVIWSVSTPSEIGTSPAVVDGVLYLGVGSQVYALEASSGTVIWQSVVPGAMFVSGTPAVSGGLVYLSSQDHNLYALDITDGSLAWTGVTGDLILASPAVAYGKVFVGSYDHKLYAFDALTGDVDWTGRTADQISSSVAVANGVVYVTSNDLNLYAFRASNGKGLVKLAVSGCAGAGSPESSSPAVANGMVFVGSADSCLYAFGLA